MDSYVTGELIKELREKKGLTQKELANTINVSEKTISKWENKRGLPDICLLEPLAKALNVSLYELLNGKQIINCNKSANLLKSKIYVCPICKNIIISSGNCNISCCGTNLIDLEAEEANACEISIDKDEIYINIDNPMTKEDYILFISYITSDKIFTKRLYPEMNAEAIFLKQGHGVIYYYSIRNGLYKKKV